MSPEEAAQQIISLARGLLSAEGAQEFSRLAFQMAGESQKATAIPALTLVAAVALLAVIAWLVIVRWAWGVIVDLIRQ